MYIDIVCIYSFAYSTNYRLGEKGARAFCKVHYQQIKRSELFLAELSPAELSSIRNGPFERKCNGGAVAGSGAQGGV